MQWYMRSKVHRIVDLPDLRTSFVNRTEAARKIASLRKSLHMLEAVHKDKYTACIRICIHTSLTAANVHTYLHTDIRIFTYIRTCIRTHETVQTYRCTPCIHTKRQLSPRDRLHRKGCVDSCAQVAQSTHASERHGFPAMKRHATQRWRFQDCPNYTPRIRSSWLRALSYRYMSRGSELLAQSQKLPETASQLQVLT